MTNNETLQTKAMTHWLTLAEAALYLKMGKSTLYDLARKRIIPAHKMGGEWRFGAEDLDGWVKSEALSGQRKTTLPINDKIHSED